LQLSGLAATLRRLADAGPRDFYEGEIAAGIIRDLQAMGGNLSAADLKNFHARIVEPIESEYRGAQIALPPSLTAGPTMLRALAPLRDLHFQSGGPQADAFVAYAGALREAYAERLNTMGDNSDRRDPSTTTHLNVIDRHGNMVALTQTLLSVFGSKVVLPSSGVLMNNGIMWFDPEPGKPNSLAPNKRCLANYSPVIGEDRKGRRFAIGASGGRKILGTVMQLTSFLMDHGLSLEEAFHQPRLDVSGGPRIVADKALSADVMQALGKVMPVEAARSTTYPYAFACPAGVMRDGDLNMGCTEIMSPYGDAVSGG
jgi:gamma-glutamyltranspeptidase/glutathione hydrolase